MLKLTMYVLFAEKNSKNLYHCRIIFIVNQKRGSKRYALMNVSIKPTTKAVCPICGKGFSASWWSKYHLYGVCSRECLSVKVRRICAYCGKEFWTRYDIKHKLIRKFCSRECLKASRESKIEKRMEYALISNKLEFKKTIPNTY